MSKITLPLTAVETGGALNSFYYNKCVLRSDVSKTNDGVNVIATDSFSFSLSEVASILNNGGEVSEYLMAVRAPIALLDVDVPVGLPKRLTLDGTATEVAKAFKNWLVPNAEIWVKDDNTEILFYTNPFAGNPSDYLLGSEIKLIFDISAQVTVVTIEDAEAEVVTGWTKL